MLDAVDAEMTTPDEPMPSPPHAADADAQAQVQADVDAAPAVPDDAADGVADDAIEQGVGAPAALRIQTARLRALEEEAAELRAALVASTEAAAAAEKLARDEQQYRVKLERGDKSLRSALDKEKTAAKDAKERAAALEQELSQARMKGEAAVKELKAAQTEARAREVRLNRSTDELDRYRSQLRELRSARDGAGHDAKLDSQRLAAELARMRKRQNELLLAFRKQARLIDVLKRQKLHAEAACTLGFTEQEFMRCIELGEQLVA